MKNTSAILLLVLSIGLFYTFTNPTYGDAKELSLKAGEYKNVLKNVSEISATRDRLLISYNSLPPAELERLSKALPQNVDTVRLALDLDTIAAQYGITLKDVAIDDGAERNSGQIVLPGSDKPYQKVMVNVRFVSSYENFRKFIEDLEKSLRIMDIRGVNFQVGDSNLYEHEILLETYWVE